MRITAEWYESIGSCCYLRTETFEGETRAEIDKQIEARVPRYARKDVIIVGLRNTLRDFAAYTTEIPGAEEVTAAQLAAECPHGFMDSPRVESVRAPRRRRVADWFRSLWRTVGRLAEH